MHKALLRRWCDAMLKYQLHDTGDTRLDGGLLCPACMRVHGRSADAILPLVTQWQTDGDERCLHAAEKLFAWSANMRRPDSSMNNDTNSSWNGITVFYANALGETLLWYGDKLPAADRDFFRSHRLRELLLRGLYGAYAGVQPRVGKARVNL